MKIRILLTDDASFIRDLIKRTLRKFLPQSEIIEASDGRKAQSILNRQPIDLILSDWEMPGMSGEELLQWVRSHDKHGDTPFIMITSLGGKEHIMRAVQAGVSDYLGKPFTGEELMHKVQKALVKSGKLTKGSSPAGAKGGPFSSLEVFSGKSDAIPNTSVDALTAAARPKDSPRLKGTGLIFWEGTDFKCMVKAISLEEVLLVCKRGDKSPGVFDRVSLTLSPGNRASKSINHINAYVHSCAAVEKKPDAEFINLILRFTDLTADQNQLLGDFILENP
jgi:DNA-binding response OmpR family regulator